MKKTTINRLLYTIIAFLLVIICVLLFKIATRPRYISEEAPATLAIQEVSLSDITDIQNNNYSQPDALTSSEADTSSIDTSITSSDTDNTSGKMTGKTSTKVNIREKSDDQSRILETVEEGYTFEILEILSEGWVKIAYQDGYGYISSAYVIITKNKEFR